MKRKIKFAAPIIAVLAGVLSSSAQSVHQVRIDFDPATTKVEFTLGDVLHTVRGDFRLKSGNIQFDSVRGTATGLLVVDVTSGQSGNGTRDRKMHKEVLESSKYPEATFLPKRVVGTLAQAGRSQVQVEGIFRMHGTDHELTLNVPVQVDGNQLRIETHFDIPFVRWGLKDPSTFVLRVNKEVQMSISGTERVSF